MKVEGKWAGNGLRFATQEEAIGSAMLTRMRWWMVEDVRATESLDPINYRFENNDNVAVAA